MTWEGRTETDIGRGRVAETPEPEKIGTNSMKKIDLLRRPALLILLAGSSFAANDLLLRVDPSVVRAVAKEHALKIEKQLKSDGVYLVSLPPGALPSAVLEALKSDRQVLNAEPNQKMVLTKNPK